MGFDGGSAASGAATGAAIGSVVPGIGTALGAVIGGLGGGLLGGSKKKSKSLEDMLPAWQRQIGPDVASWARKGIEQYDPMADYEGISKMMTPSMFEQQGLDMLGQYANQATPNNTATAEAEINKILGGGYNPLDSAYYKNMRSELNKAKGERIKSLNSMIGKYGLQSSSYRGNEYADIETDMMDSISNLIGQVFETERNRQTSVLPLAVQLGQYKDTVQENTPVSRISNLMNFGSLPRLLETVGYEDFLRKQAGGSELVNTYKSMYPSGQPMYKMDYDVPNTASKILATTGPAAASFLGGGGGSLQQLLAAFGGMV